MKILKYLILAFLLISSTASAETIYDNCSSAKTNSAQVECLDKEIARLQKILEASYQKQLSVLEQHENKKTADAFADSQKKWRSFLIANCNVHSADNSRYGQIAALICSAKMTASRIDEVEEIFKP